MNEQWASIPHGKLLNQSFRDQLNSLQILEQLAPLELAKQHLPVDIIDILVRLGKADNIPFNQLYYIMENCADIYYTKVIKTFVSIIKRQFADWQLLLVNTVRCLKFLDKYSDQQSQIIAMIAFLLKYRKTMQVMLAAFLQMNTKNTGIQSVQANQIGRTYPLLFTLNLPKEEEIIDDLREITAMEYVVQVIMIIVCIAVVIIVMCFCCTKCRHNRTIFKYCIPFLPISRIICTSQHTDLFVEVTNITKGNGIWAHFTSTGCFSSQIQLSRPIQKNNVQIETFCCIFKCIRVNWLSIIVIGIEHMFLYSAYTGYVSIFTDNDLTHCWMKYMSYHHLCSHRGRMMHSHKNMNIHSHILVHMVQDHQHLSSQNICIRYLAAHRHRVWLYHKNLLYIGFIISMT